MGLCGGIVGLAGATRRCAGLWRYLAVRVKGRVAVELEQERNRATAEVIRLLPENCEFLEYEPAGRLRVIRRTGPADSSPAAPGIVLPGHSERPGR